MSSRFEPLVEYPAFEISEYPYVIRNVDTKEVVEPIINRDGYVTVSLGNVTEFLHHIVSVQFKNGKRNVIRRKYEFVEALTPNVIEITEYKGRTFDKYYYEPDTDQIVMEFRGKYKVVLPVYSGTSATVAMTDVNGKLVNVSYFRLLSELKKQIRDGTL